MGTQSALKSRGTLAPTSLSLFIAVSVPDLLSYIENLESLYLCPAEFSTGAALNLHVNLGGRRLFAR